jgi:hypothetical protein
MALCELRAYTLRVGAMAEAVKLYQEIGAVAARTRICQRTADAGAIGKDEHTRECCASLRTKSAETQTVRSRCNVRIAKLRCGLFAALT